MARRTIAQLEQTIADLQQTVGVHSTDKANKDVEIKRLRALLSKLMDDNDTLRANRYHNIAILEQMRGYIRAHHTERRPTGLFTNEYNQSTGNYDSVQQFTDSFPFDDIIIDELTPRPRDLEEWQTERYMK